MSSQWPQSAGPPLPVHSCDCRPLTLDDAPLLQGLFDASPYFALITDGAPYPPTAGRDEFYALPPGRDLRDKNIIGFFDRRDWTTLIAALESLQRYPDDHCWWIGLLLVRPDRRGRGLGTEIVTAFERAAERAAFRTIRLSVVADNTRGMKFWTDHGYELERITEPRQFTQKTQAVHVFVKHLRTPRSTDEDDTATD
ncbi:MAG: GNAT family N-acetyltransferase [Ilumatobacteraceae bacterium]